VVSDWPETKSSGLKAALVQLLLIFYGSLRGKSAPGSQKRTPVLLGKNAGLTEGNPQLEFLWNGKSYEAQILGEDIARWWLSIATRTGVLECKTSGKTELKLRNGKSWAAII